MAAPTGCGVWGAEMNRLDSGNSLLSELKRWGADNPDNGFVTAYSQSLSDSAVKKLRSTFRTQLKKKQRACQITGSRINLVASHIKPLRHCVSEEEALHPCNGLLLRGDHDQLFDKGFISFDEGGSLMISSQISQLLGPMFTEQLIIAFGQEWIRSWQNGGSKCKIKPIFVPPKVKHPKYSFQDRKHREARKAALQAARARDEFMDYHRRHIFKHPMLGLQSQNDNG